MSKLIDFAFYQVPDQDLVIMEFLLSLLEKQTDSETRVTETDTSDIAIINIDQVSGLSLYEKLSKTPNSPICICYTENLSGSNAEYKLSNPIRSAEFLTVCKNVLTNNPSIGTKTKIHTSGVAASTPKTAAPVQKPMAAPAAAEPVARSNISVMIKRPSKKRLVNLLLEDKDNYHAPIRVSTSSLDIYIDFSTRTFYTEHKPILLSMLCKSAVESLSIEDVSDGVFNKIKQDLPAQRIGDLIWYSALLGCSGELDHNITDKTVMHLKRWPSLVSQTQLPKHIKHFLVKLTAFMTKNGATLNEIASRTQVPAETLVNFINACHYLNYIDDKKPLESAKSSAITNEVAGSGLFGKLRNKFGMNNEPQ